MKDGVLEQFVRTLYYAPLPAMAIDGDGKVADYNLALEALVGDQLSGSRYLPVSTLGARLKPRILNGSFFPGNEGPSSQPQCTFASDGFGEVQLNLKTIVCHDPITSGPYAKFFLWDVLVPSCEHAFHEKYRRKLDHQLIWDTYAWSYDRVLPVMPYYVEVLDRHTRVLTGALDGQVMDLGAGTGNLIERVLAAGRQVTAVDNSRAMLDKLRVKPPVRAELRKRLLVIEARAEYLPMVADQSHAAVSLQLALFDMYNPERGLETAVRVLRPGGSIVITDLKRSFRLEPLLKECKARLRTLGLYKERADDLKRVVKSNRDLAPGSRSRFRIEDTLEFLKTRKFQDLSIEDSHLGQCATVRGRKAG